MISKEQLIEEYTIKRMSLRNIAIKYGHDPKTISSLCKKYDICIRNNDTKIDLSNMIVGHFKVLYRLDTKGYDGCYLWVCECTKCKQNYNISSHKLNKKKIKQCSKCRIKEGGEKLSTGIKNLSGKYIGQIKRGAIERKLKYKLSLKYLYFLYEKQQGRCALTNLEIHLGKFPGELGKDNRTASLDRIDSSKGYVEGNVQWVHKDVNKMKQNLNEDYFKYLCKLIVNKD